MLVHMVKDDAEEIVFQRSMAVRAGLSIILVVLDVMCYLYFAQQISGTKPGDNPYVWSIPMLLVIVVNALGLRFIGPDELKLHIARQGYTITKGLPFFARITTGSFGDFYGLCVRPHKNKRGDIFHYTIELDWNAPDRQPCILAEADTIKEAQQKQQEYAARLVTVPLAKD